MILAIAYSHRDVHQCLRLLSWIGFLSMIKEDRMRSERLLLVPSRHASQLSTSWQIASLAPYIFGKAHCFVPESEDESGWPASCNFMFRQALLHVEHHFQDDMLWLEPDAIPITPHWWDAVTAQFEIARGEGKSFMGAYVKHHIDHMTGVGVYGRDWRQIAPTLVEATTEAWDTYSAKQVLPHAYFTDLIQHIFHQPVITGTHILRPNTAIFHQDKSGRLIALLDQQEFGGQANCHFPYREIQPEPVMRRFFHAANATRMIKSQGFDFIFDKYDNFGGAWRGVYMTDHEGEIIALNALAANPATGITEISQAAYEAKKKVRIQASNSSNPSSKPLLAQINQSPAVLVAEPPPQADKTAPSISQIPVADKIEDVLLIDTVRPPSEPPPTIKPRARRPRKTIVV